ncbi:oligosaccharide repeat unit polymerase [Aliagarivorans taiwanensis]|uniref:oligosaccharide repeat unit polymerase n=1 Tax=Aliagarivorans taiwanensis TaxID=561966 RepID=UPI00146FC587|nr:oligosaccharide repeat unit polymerase [Aliagarivorans taiwanensis]
MTSVIAYLILSACFLLMWLVESLGVANYFLVSLFSFLLIAYISAVFFIELARGADKAFLKSRPLIMLSLVFLLLQDSLLVQNGLDEFSGSMLFSALKMIYIYVLMFEVAYFFANRYLRFGVLHRVMSIAAPESDVKVTSTIPIKPVTYLIVFFVVLQWGRWLYLTDLDFWNVFVELSKGRSTTVLRNVVEGRGNIASLIDTICELGFFALPSLLTLRASWSRNIFSKLFFALLICFVILVYTLKGARAPVLFSFCQVLAVLVLLDKRKVAAFFVFPTLIVFMLFVFDQMVLARVSGWGNMGTDLMSQTGRETVGFHHDDNFYWLTNIIYFVPEKFPYTDLKTFLSVAFLNWIPRFIWPGKPKYEMEHVWPERLPWTSESIVGDLYWVGGVFAILIGSVLHAFVASSLDDNLSNAKRNPYYAVLYLVLTLLLLMATRAVFALTSWSYYFFAVWLSFFVIKFFVAYKLKRYVGSGFVRGS